MKVATPQDLLLEDIRDLFDAEKQLVRALPKMAKSAHDPELRQAFREHQEMTRNQVQRLERIFALLEAPARGKPCAGMRGIVEEGQEIMGEDRLETLKDASLVTAARKVEHYEIVSYEAARALAQQMGRREAAQLLPETLEEEMQTDRRLAQISRRLVKEAMQAKPAGEREMGRGRGMRRGGRVAAAGSSGAGMEE